MHEEIEFSRQVCERDDKYVIVQFRIPRVLSSDANDTICGEFKGTAARLKLVKCMFAMTCGMLDLFGCGSLAQAMMASYADIERAIHDEDNARNTRQQGPARSGVGRAGTH